jgi:predicted membrane-bound spermidine synthase
MLKKSSLWTISFIEGGMVMMVELCAAKLLAPYFGTSVEVWAATLAVTLGGLTSGYFYGAYQAGKSSESNYKVLKVLFIIAALLVITLPVIAHPVMGLFLDFSLTSGSLMSLMLILFPVLFLLGSCSPLIINLLNNHKANPGDTAGKVYAVSTLGGILFTLLTGFYFISVIGIKFTLVGGGLFMGLAALIFLTDFKTISTLAIMFVLLVASTCSAMHRTGYNPAFKVLYESDGLMGNIKVIEHDAAWYGKPDKTGRGLVVNNTLQTFMDIQNPENSGIWAWSNIIPTAISVYPKGKTKVLLCGLGGATIVKQLQRLGFEYDIVELDSRIEKIAKMYFFMRSNIPVTIDDARHYIKTSKSKYDVIIFDTFLSESAPEHLLTREALAEAKSILNPGGLLLANFYGFTSGPMGYAARSVIATFEEAGFVTGVIATPGKEENRNLLILGTDRPLDFTKAYYNEEGSLSIGNLHAFMIPLNALDMADAEILTDNNPKLARLYSSAARSWKKAYNEFYTKQLLSK